MPSLISYQRRKTILACRRVLRTWSQLSSPNHPFHSRGCPVLQLPQHFAALQQVPTTSSLLRLPELSSWKCHSRTFDTFEEQPSSWLFISDALAGAYGAQVNLNLGLEKRLKSEDYLNSMKRNIALREMSFDLDSLVSNYETMTVFMKKRKDLNRKLEDLRQKLKAVSKSGDSEKASVMKDMKMEMEEAKVEMKDTMNLFWAAEKKVMSIALRLPNDVHPNTPLGESVVLEEKINPEAKWNKMSHVKIGKEFDLIKFSNVGPQAFYLKGQVAHAARKLSDHACGHLLGQAYRLMSGPNFFKTPIMESCGRDVFNTEEVLTMRHVSEDVEPMTHLAGVSLMTFAAYVAKVCVGDLNLPMKMFSIGPHYQSVKNPKGLYHSSQSSQVGLFCCCSENDAESQFDEMVKTVWDYLSSFGFSVRLTQRCASELRPEERRQIQVELWAPSLNQFVPVGHVSDHGDYISRRQMSIHNRNHSDIRHTRLLHMVSGCAVNMTALLAAWMELSDVQAGKFCLKDLPFCDSR